MILPDRVRPSSAPRRLLGAALLALVFVAGGCIGRGDAFAGPECEDPVTPIPPVEDTSSDSTPQVPTPDPSPDLNPCSAPDV